MGRFFLAHGMKRSGNHAVLQWLLAQDRFRFFNNLIPVSPILSGRRALPEPRDFDRWRREKLSPQEQGSGVSLCASLEDHPPTVRFFRALPPDGVNLLIVRDPANLFASRIRKAGTMDHPAYPRQPGPLLTRVVENWKAHAREFLGDTSVLANKVGVYFNAWFADPAYRRTLSARLGLEFTDAGFARVDGTGGGSSFDRTDFDGDNRNMRVLDRPAQLDALEADLLAGVLADDEIRDLGHRIATRFGKPSGE